jgi:hypothetical protein
MLSAPAPSSDDILDEAVAAAARLGLVRPNTYVVGGGSCWGCYWCAGVAAGRVQRGMDERGAAW